MKGEWNNGWLDRHLLGHLFFFLDNQEMVCGPVRTYDPLSESSPGLSVISYIQVQLQQSQRIVIKIGKRNTISSHKLQMWQNIFKTQRAVTPVVPTWCWSLKPCHLAIWSRKNNLSYMMSFNLWHSTLPSKQLTHYDFWNVIYIVKQLQFG